MTNPYHNRPSHTFWQSGVVDHVSEGVDPIIGVNLSISQEDAIATAGSCFAQHISRTLLQLGFRYLVTESYLGEAGTFDENYAVFPARFGNIYTSRQLLQLFDRAYGLFRPRVDVWRGKNGEIIDPFRPRIQTTGFSTVDLLEADRERHFTAVRRMFEQCNVFIFTLGLTETWISPLDGSAFPLAPGVVAPNTPANEGVFHNMGVMEIIEDLNCFLDKLFGVNAKVKVIFTVSPVPLIATYENRHVLVSTIASKSILRAAVEEIIRLRPEISYFPSYEVITGPQTYGRYYAPDLREITSEGVSYVMSIFKRHYLASLSADTASVARSDKENVIGRLSSEDEQRMAELAEVVCDEKAILG